ncbi:MAG TPA: CDP-glucose 4,6-dehydratase [Verrucomicrobiae bacterium]|nr:CDP-glucose 4,6-dehydratase [Verrucomicrobiae bacterium]
MPKSLFNGAFAGKKIFVTGHTGFKGSWLCEWLLPLGAKITGYSLPPETRPALFEQLKLKSRLNHLIGDIRDLPRLRRELLRAKPDFVFHLAAQPLVRESYAQPRATFETNLMGTVNVLEALRDLKRPCAAVFITTDKCYENRERHRGYREEDPLGGYDPYSASKATAEIAISSYRRSFFQKHPVKIASVRAGNVIGGGDWAMDRIVPDCIRALKAGKVIGVRNPAATRPWQHVLEPLSGYLWLAAKLSALRLSEDALCSAFNFGPRRESNRTVGELVEEILKHWPGRWADQSDPRAVHEAKLLFLETAKAGRVLRWHPVWKFGDTIRQTVEGYRAMVKSSAAAQETVTSAIAGYCAAARAHRLPWT